MNKIISLYGACIFVITGNFSGNETEISYFNHGEYEQYKANPQMLW